MSDETFRQRSNSEQTRPVEYSADNRFARVSSTQFNEELSRTESKVIYRGLNNEDGCEISWHVFTIQQIPQEALLQVKEDLRGVCQLSHPSLIRWLDHWFKFDTLVVITEMMPDGSLRDYLQKIKTPRVKVIRQWAKQILEGLLYLHTLPEPIIHGGLQPENLFVIPHTGSMKMGGFWKTMVIHQLGSRASLPYQFQYMAPEQLRDMKVDGVDVYALGMCLLEMCTQISPYEECKSSTAIFHRVLAGHRPISLDRIINEDVKEFIEMCIRPVQDRPSVTQLLASPFISGASDALSQVIQLKPNSDSYVPEANEIDIEMIIPGTVDRNSQKINFHFNLESDTPEAVAAEMVLELNLPMQMTPTLTRQIYDHLNPFTSPLFSDSPTPSTSRESLCEVELDEDEDKEQLHRKESSPTIVESISLSL